MHGYPFTYKFIEFSKEIQFQPGYDHRNDPNKQQYGCHGMQLRFLLHGPKASVQFMIMTDWLPTWESMRSLTSGAPNFGPLPADVGYHADVSQYEGQERQECDCRPIGQCYYDGSGLAADELFKKFVQDGEKAVWDELLDYYMRLFGDEE